MRKLKVQYWLLYAKQSRIGFEFCLFSSKTDASNCAKVWCCGGGITEARTACKNSSRKECLWVKNDGMKLTSRLRRCSDNSWNEWKGIESDEPVEGVDVGQWTDLGEDSQKAVDQGEGQEWCHVTGQLRGS